MRRPRRQHRRPLPWIAALVAALGSTAPAADPSPAVVASFTQRVQPLVLNRCATGACHGGPESPAPRFRRAPGNAPPDRTHTRANLAAFLEAIGPERDARPLAALLAAGHPAAGGAGPRRAAPLTTPERATLDRWLAEVRAAEGATAAADPGVVPVSAETEVSAPPPPNRFRELLDAAAHPPELPPPQEPPGVIFKNDAPPAE